MKIGKNDWLTFSLSRQWFQPMSVLGLLILFTVATPAREFTSYEGQKLEADITFVKDGVVTLKLANGKNAKVPTERFSKADQEFIAAWEEENKGKVPEHLKNKKPRIDINVNSGRTQKRDNNFSGYVDERKQELKPSVVLKSRDAVYPIIDAKLIVIVTGNSPETRENAVVYKKVFEGITLPLNEELRFEADEFELWYDDRGAMYGHKFKGYLVWMEDPEGKVLVESLAPSGAAKSMDNVRKLEVGDIYDKDYKKIGSEDLRRSVKGLAE